MGRNRKEPHAKTKGPAQLSEEEIARLRDELLRKRAAILANVDEIEGEALRRSRSEASGDLSYAPIHMADVGTDSYNQDLALNLADGERELLQEVDAALQRIEEGTYGFCEATGQPIGRARLEAIPWAKYCVEYARRLEGRAGGGGR